MKKLKKIFSLLLVMVVTFSFAIPAFAVEGPGSITITNATVGKEYKAYKIFDATVGAEGEIAYTISGSDAWYSQVSGEGSPFKLTDIGNGEYAVSVKEDTEEAVVLAWLKTQVEGGAAGTEAKKTTADSTTVVFSDVAFGYYYITSGLGTVITVSNVDSDIQVIDKNQVPGWDPEDPENPDDSGEQGKFVAEASDGDYAKESTASIGDTAWFKINAFVPKYSGAKQVHTYTFTDTLAAGFTYNGDIQVTVAGLELTPDADYKITVDGQTITVELYASEIADYPSDAHLSVTYSAKVDKDAAYDNVNTVSMEWTVIDPEDPDTPEDPDPEDPEEPQYPEDSKTDTYTYGFNLQKYKETAEEGNEIDGAKFRLYDAETEGNEIQVVSTGDGTYRVAEEGESGVEIEAGAAVIFGLGEGTYYLEETKAPDGYNKLTARHPITVSAEGSGEDGYLTNEVQIVNKAGASLPETGGIGTTVFYVTGAVLMAGAAVLLITKKKMSGKKD